MKIELPIPQVFAERGAMLPSSLWKNPPFKFDPQPFGIKHDRLEDRIYSANDQKISYERFVSSVFSPVIYGVGAAPDDTYAKMFAAFLTYKFIKETTAVNSVAWVSTSLNRSSESQSTLKDLFHKSPSLLVITGLTPNTPQFKLDLVHEVCEHHSGIPRILVIAGEDPVTYFYTRLFLPLNNLFFHSKSIVKRQVQVV